LKNLLKIFGFFFSTFLWSITDETIEQISILWYSKIYSSICCCTFKDRKRSKYQITSIFFCFAYFYIYLLLVQGIKF
jgi:hypothetical protein